MFRLFLALNFLLLNLYACRGGYESCKLKIKHSHAIQNQTLQIPVTKNRLLIYSKKMPDAKIIKYNPFLNLYLIKDKKRFKYPFKINNHLYLGIASVNSRVAIEGKILKHQVGLNSFATFNEPLFKPSLLLNSCCSLEGIVTPEGIIEKAYLQRFLNNKESLSTYGDIGIRVADRGRCITITDVNTFIDANPFEVGDCVLSFDGKRIRQSSTLMQKILFAKIGSTHSIKITRDNKTSIHKVKILKRQGGGYLSDTFLEFLGISFDKNLYVVKIEKKAQKYGLKLGDRLIQINLKDITNRADILRVISESRDATHLLFQREEFQFFIRVN